MEKTILTQIAKIKNLTVSILTYQKDRVTLNERTYLNKIYEFMDDILLDRATHKNYSNEEYIDSVLIEYKMVLRASRNSEVKKLSKLLEEGIKW